MTLKKIFSYILRIPRHKMLAGVLTLALVNDSVPSFAASSIGQIEQIDVQETAKSIEVILRGHDFGKCDPLLLRDPKGRRMPILSLSFQNTGMNASLQGTQSGIGNVLSVDAQQVSAQPPITQVLVSLAGDVHYRLKRNKTIILIEVEKGGLAEDTTPSIPSPAVNVPSTPLHQTIQPGDVLFISISPADELSRDLVVDQNGKISIPLIGTVDTTGLSSEALAHKAAMLLSKYLTNPRVDILIKQFNSQTISLMGEVHSPGSYPYHANIRLLDVISMAGGFLPNANKSQIRVHRGTGTARKALLVDAGETLKTGDVTKDFLLQPGDLVEIPKGVNPLTIFGAVEHGGNFDYYRDIRLLDLISMTLGLRDGAATQRILIYRGEPPTQKVITVRFSRVLEGKMEQNILLQPGDLVYVPTRALWTYSSAANALAPITTLLLTAATLFLAAKK